MSSHSFRVESSRPIVGQIWPAPGSSSFGTSNRVLAVALAAKSLTSPPGGEIRVVHVPTGEVVFCKPADDRLTSDRTH
jgi:hypothetical protein